MPEVDVGPAQVIARRQPGLEDHHRRAGVGQDNPVKLHPHGAIRAERIDPHVRAARVDEDLLVLFEPGIQRSPVETDRAGQTADR
jgi:hypothetical protein